MPHPSVEQILAPDFLEGLTERSLPEIRARRDEVTEVETGLSYLRRLVQGRLDIVLSERSRRQAGLPPEDLAALVVRLPQILGDHVHAPGLGRLTTITAPGDGDVDAELLGAIEAVLPTATMAHLADLTDDEVTAASDALEALERDISGRRRALHTVLDALQEEIVRRYRSGEASVDTLLQ